MRSFSAQAIVDILLRPAERLLGRCSIAGRVLCMGLPLAAAMALMLSMVWPAEHAALAEARQSRDAARAVAPMVDLIAALQAQRALRLQANEEMSGPSGDLGSGRDAIGEAAAIAGQHVMPLLARYDLSTDWEALAGQLRPIRNGAIAGSLEEGRVHDQAIAALIGIIQRFGAAAGLNAVSLVAEAGGWTPPLEYLGSLAEDAALLGQSAAMMSHPGNGSLGLRIEMARIQARHRASQSAISLSIARAGAPASMMSAQLAGQYLEAFGAAQSLNAMIDEVLTGSESAAIDGAAALALSRRAASSAIVLWRGALERLDAGLQIRITKLVHGLTVVAGVLVMLSVLLAYLWLAFRRSLPKLDPLTAQGQEPNAIASIEAQLRPAVEAARAGDFTHRLEPGHIAPAWRPHVDQLNQLLSAIADALAEDRPRASAGAGEGGRARRIDSDEQARTRARQQVAHVQRAAERISKAAREIAAASQVAAEIRSQCSQALARISGARAAIEASFGKWSAIANRARGLARRLPEGRGQGVDPPVTAARVETVHGRQRRTGDVATSVEGLAFRAHVAALNAAIEAARARAREHGPGLAALAAQVRSVAVLCAQLAAGRAPEEDEPPCASELDALAETVAGVRDECGMGSAELARAMRDTEGLLDRQADLIEDIAEVAVNIEDEARGFADWDASAMTAQENGPRMLIDGLGRVRGAAPESNILSAWHRGRDLSEDIDENRRVAAISAPLPKIRRRSMGAFEARDEWEQL